MKNTKLDCPIVKALLIGLLLGIVDAVMIPMVDPNWNYYSLAVVITFWSIVSLVTKVTNIGGKIGVQKGIIWSVILNIPWLFNFASLGLMDYVILVPVFAVVYGAIIGFLNMKFNN